MTLAAIRPVDARAARRRELTRQLAEVTRELLALERAEQRIPTVVEPPAAELAAYNPLATRAQRVRAWASDQGLACGKAGRIPAAILAAYAAAHPDEEPTP
jgi:hypothetical protein